jgi:hypothetical protein
MDAGLFSSPLVIIDAVSHISVGQQVSGFQHQAVALQPSPLRS